MKAPTEVFVADLRVRPENIKSLRETLCLAQQRADCASQKKHLQHLIDECDRHRPLGPDGKHGRRHTTTCGCEDR